MPNEIVYLAGLVMATLSAAVTFGHWIRGKTLVFSISDQVTIVVVGGPQPPSGVSLA